SPYPAADTQLRLWKCRARLQPFPPNATWQAQQHLPDQLHTLSINVRADLRAHLIRNSSAKAHHMQPLSLRDFAPPAPRIVPVASIGEFPDSHRSRFRQQAFAPALAKDPFPGLSGWRRRPLLPEYARSAWPFAQSASDRT